MYDAFKKWSLLGHTFAFVKLTPTEVESLGAATRQFLEPDEDGDSNGNATVREERVVNSTTLGRTAAEYSTQCTAPAARTCRNVAGPIFVLCMPRCLQRAHICTWRCSIRGQMVHGVVT